MERGTKRRDPGMRSAGTLDVRPFFYCISETDNARSHRWNPAEDLVDHCGGHEVLAMAEPVMGDFVADDGVQFDGRELGDQAFGQDDLRFDTGYADGNESRARDDHHVVATHVTVASEERVNACAPRVETRTTRRRERAANDRDRDRAHRDREFESTERKTMDRRIAETRNTQGIGPVEDRRRSPQCGAQNDAGEAERHRCSTDTSEPRRA